VRPWPRHREDHAAGSYWSDRLGNREHRIDKAGRLVDVRPECDRRVGCPPLRHPGRGPHDPTMAEPSGNRYRTTPEELETSARVPLAEQVASVDPDRGATLTSSAEWSDMRWLLAAGGAGGASLGAALGMGDGDGD
jgi:hypothetical protein